MSAPPGEPEIRNMSRTLNTKNSPNPKLRSSSSFHQENKDEAEEEIWKYLTRAEKIKRTKFPSTKPGRFVIPSKNDGFGFKTLREHLDNWDLPVTHLVVNDVILSCNRVVNQVYCRKRRNDDYDFLQSNTIYLQLLSVTLIIGFILLAIADANRTNDTIFVAGIILLIVTGLSVLGFGSKLIFNQRAHINLHQELKERLSNFVAKLNEGDARNSGVTYILEPEIRWIEVTYVPEILENK
jgi:hypothetical protein